MLTDELFGQPTDSPETKGKEVNIERDNSAHDQSTIEGATEAAATTSRDKEKVKKSFVNFSLTRTQVEALALSASVMAVSVGTLVGPFGTLAGLASSGLIFGAIARNRPGDKKGPESMPGLRNDS